MKKKSEIDSILDTYREVKFDFGFTSEDHRVIITSAEKKNQELAERLKKVEELVLPLLVNLLDTADKPTINWPNRGPIIKQKIEEILKLTRI